MQKMTSPPRPHGDPLSDFIHAHEDERDPFGREPTADERRPTWTLSFGDDDGWIYNNTVELASVTAPFGFTFTHTLGAWEGGIEEACQIRIQAEWDVVAAILRWVADGTHEEWAHVEYIMGVEFEVRYVDLSEWRS